ncbi:MAG: phosphofructokinase, partial [Desulfobacterales bacterium]|nr:phosphofructokinase [Desulfobacterales bacterium]
MSEKKRVSLDELLRIQNVKQLLGKLNPETDFRRQYRPEVCGVFSKPFTVLKNNDEFQFEIHRAARKDLPNIIKNRVQDVVGVDSPEPSVVENYGARRIIGVVFSGGPAPGGHNVVAGIYDAAKRANPENIVYGFLLGPDGVIENEARELTDDLIDAHRNRGGFSMIKTGRTKIDSSEKVNLSRETCKELGLDALVVVGGDDSNTNAAFLAQELMKDGVQVIGVPKTIDGDIQVRDVSGKVLCAMSFGFHSAARAFSQEIANLCTDSSSDVKYWHVCKVMGRVASHLALEVALQTHANMTLIGEDLADYVDPERIEKAEKTGEIDYTAYGLTLRHLSRVICKGIVKRAAAGKNYGVIVIPEGVLEFINEVQVFILKLSTIIADYNDTHDNTFHADFPRLANKIEYLHRLSRHLVKGRTVTPWSQRDYELFNDIPDFFQEGLLAERDSHGNFQFSQVQTEKVLMELVKDYLEILRERGEYKIGISADYFRKTLEREGLEPDIYGPVLFDNYHGGGMLRMKDAIFSLKTLKQALVKKEIIASD